MVLGLFLQGMFVMECIHSSWTLLCQNLQFISLAVSEGSVFLKAPIFTTQVAFRCFRLDSTELRWTAAFENLSGSVFDIKKMDVNEKLRESNKIFTSCRCWKVIMLCFQKGISNTLLYHQCRSDCYWFCLSTLSISCALWCTDHPSSPLAGWVSNKSKPAANQTHWSWFFCSDLKQHDLSQN